METSLEKERRHMKMMAPHDAYMQMNARKRIKKRAAALTPKTADESAVRMLNGIAGDGNPKIICGGDEDTECKYATIGLSLLGCPEVFVNWPCASMAYAAKMVLRDLILECMNGNAKEKLVVGRPVYAQGYGIAYFMTAAPSVSGSPLYEFMEANRKKSIKESGAPFAIQLKFEVDIRDGVDLPLGIKGGLGLWRKKNGVDAFTGLVRMSIPSPMWAAGGFDYCLVRMLDPTTNDLTGPCRVATPDEVVEVFSQYDE